MTTPKAAKDRVHFLGICGTAMGAVAAAMKEIRNFCFGSATLD